MIIEVATIALFFIVFKALCIWVCGYVRTGFLRARGVSDSDVTIIHSTRSSGFNLPELCQRYIETDLRIADSIGRKGMHLVFLLASMVLTQILGLTHHQAIASGIAVSTVSISAMLLLYKKDNAVSTYLFMPFSRIMDGHKGRLNMLSAQSFGLAQSVFLATLGYLGLFALADEQYTYALMYLIYLPVAVGDTMGEVVGSTIGKQRIKVMGIGDTNRKSIAGTFAVFASTLASLLAVYLLVPTPPGFLSLALLISAVSTLVELYSPRSTDTFFIPVVNVAILVASASFV